MKITLIHQYYVSTSMNGGTRSYETAKRLARMGHEVTIVTSAREFPSHIGWKVDSEEGFEVHSYPVKYSNNMGFTARVLAFIHFALAASARVAKLDAHIIYAISTPLTIAIPGVIGSKAKGIPLVFEVGDLWPGVPISMGILRNKFLIGAARFLERWAYSNSAAIIALSPQMRDGVVSTGFPRNRVSVIPNGCDLDLFHPSRVLENDFLEKRPHLVGRPILLYAGTFGEVNDVGYTVRLGNELREIGSNVAILLIGEGKQKAEVVSLASRLEVLNKNVFVEEGVPKSVAISAFASCSAVANIVAPIPALFANSANKFFDGLASAKPIFLNYDGWMTELVRKYRCGIVTSGLNFREAAILLDRLLNDRLWVEAAGLQSLRLAKNHFSRDRLVEQIDELLRAVGQGEGERASTIAPGNY